MPEARPVCLGDTSRRCLEQTDVSEPFYLQTELRWTYQIPYGQPNRWMAASEYTYTMVVCAFARLPVSRCVTSLGHVATKARDRCFDPHRLSGAVKITDVRQPTRGPANPWPNWRVSTRPWLVALSRVPLTGMH